ncbi:MAG: aminopeptidase P N-terminal domain-containing protein [Gammaproteobacteria bacterium]|nr:aminopeptidase P N-terminal domain-containing protein [Gammaproteobacteria bacterium]
MNPREFAKRRRQLMRMIGKGGVALLPAATPKIRNRDVQYYYRQDSDFFYLTGFTEPDALLVLAPGRAAGEYLLFCRERDRERETWDGARAGPEGAVEDFAADDAFPISDVDDIVPGIIEQCDRVYYTIGLNPDFDQRVMSWVGALRGRGGAHTPDEFIALDHLLHDLRLYKSRAEISAMRRAAKIAIAAHRRAMARCRPGLFEYEIEAEYTHEFRRQGARLSYLPIVGSGPNSCVLHYHANDRQLEDGDLLLADVGCESDYYASDVTRTWPVNGHFTDEQRAIYELVLEAQDAALEQIAPRKHWNDPHEAAVEVITGGLRKLGLLQGGVKTLIRDRAYKRFFMHRTGHWLGLDVHDVGDYRIAEHWRMLEPGMALTVEPGIYIPPKSRGIPKKWWGIGVRIEDDVVVTRDGHDLLTRGLPRTAEEVEALVGADAI